MQRIIFWLTAVLVANSLLAQNKNTLEITMKNAESIFIEQNLSLISIKYNVNIKEAELLQNQLWPNPTLNFELAAWDGDDRKWFRNDVNAQRVVAIEQEIILGGKRRSQKKLDQIDIKISDLEFSELLRNLKREVRLTFAEYYYSTIKVEQLKLGIEPLEGLIFKYEAQYEKGNTSKIEVARLKALLISLHKSYLDERKKLAELESSIKVLLNIKHDVKIIPIVNDEDIDNDQLLLNESKLLEIALEYRPDVNISIQEVLYTKQKIDREKREAIPNLTVGALYDRRGAAQNDYIGITAGIDVPIFDRNQGNIQKSKIESEQASIKHQQQLEVLNGEIYVAHNKYWLSQELQSSIDKEFYTDLKEILQSSLSQFSKKNISLLEFVDLYESIENGMNEFIEIQIDSIQAKEEINFTVGKDVFSNSL